MEDLEEEYWEIEDYYKQSSESNGKLRWIWKKGLRLGKKMVMTGVVISSAPIVLPPVVVISTFGFAFSLPAGFAIIIYACTDKLMNCLLPMPLMPPLLEYGNICSDDEEDKVYGYDINKGYKDNEGLEIEETKLEKDARKEIEMRIELVDEGNNEVDSYEKLPDNKDETGRSIEISEIVEEEYGEDIGKGLEDEEECLNSNAIPVIMEGIREAENEISLTEKDRDDMSNESLQAVVVGAEIDGENEDNVEQVIEESGHVDYFSDINEEEMRRETTGLIEEMRDENRDHEQRGEFEWKGEPLVDDVTQNKENTNLFVIPEETKPVVEDVLGINHELSEERPKADESITMRGEPEFVVEKQLVAHVETLGDHTTSDINQGTSSDRKSGTLVLSNEDARETEDESGFALFDHGNVESAQTTDAANMKSKGILPLVTADIRSENEDNVEQGENEENVEQVNEESAIVGPQDVNNENEHVQNLTDIDEMEMRRETLGLIEEARGECRDDDHRKEFEEKEELLDTTDDVSRVGADEIDQELGAKADSSGTMQREPDCAVEKQLAAHVKTLGDHTTTDVHQGTSSDKKSGILVFSNADGREMENENGVDLFNHGNLESDQTADTVSMKSEVRLPLVTTETGGENEDNVEQVIEELENRHVENFSSFSEMNSEGMRRETSGLIEETRGENRDQQQRKEFEEKEESLVNDMTQNTANMNLFVIPEVVKPVDVQVLNDSKSHGTTETNQELSEDRPKADESVTMQGESECVVEEQLVVHVKTLDEYTTTTDVNQGTSSDWNRQNSVSSNADEIWFDSFDHENVEPDNISGAINDLGSKEEGPSLEKSTNVSVDYHEIRIESKLPMPEDAKTTSNQDNTAGSDEVSLIEDKIWEKIHLMRIILGYRHSVHSSCVEELNALYMFTGIEPPVSSNNPSDLMDINENLQSLMSIVGVK